MPIQTLLDTSHKKSVGEPPRRHVGNRKGIKETPICDSFWCGVCNLQESSTNQFAACKHVFLAKERERGGFEIVLHAEAEISWLVLSRWIAEEDFYLEFSVREDME